MARSASSRDGRSAVVAAGLASTGGFVRAAPWGRTAGLDVSLCGATESFFITRQKGRPVLSMWATAFSMAGPISASSIGNQSQATFIVSSIWVVIAPMSSCCGSSCGPPGSPRSVTMSSTGIRKTALSEVSGETALPRPEFCIITIARLPASSAPVPIATASPSFVAPMYVRSGESMT